MLNKEFINKTLAYYAKLPKEALIDFLGTSPDGLTEKEAILRLNTYGKNNIKEEPKSHIIFQFLANFKNPLVLILMVVSIISFFTGETLDALIVMMMVLMSVILNFFQEYKASKASEKLKAHITSMATVIRARVKKEIAASNLCVGDIIEFNAGDIIPADCRILHSKDLYTNQSSLTGESFPVEKSFNEVETQNPALTELSNILFHGTSVVTGSATAVVVKTGTNTEFGKIAQQLSTNDTDNEFTKGISKFSVFILRIIIIFVIFILIANSLLKHNFLESLLFSIAIAVGLTPEFLPMIMSVTMAKGSLNMSKKGVIVKKLSAIPSFGSMDILCTDKTGTLTEDKIELVTYTDIYGKHSEKVLTNAYINSSFQTGITNPMDTAIKNYKSLNISDYTKRDEIPFDFMRKRMSVIVDDHHKDTWLITKGAPEQVFTCCKYFDDDGVKKPIDSTKADNLVAQYTKLSNDGFRVLAVAIKKLDSKKSSYEANDEKDLELLGYTAFLDPPKKDAKKAIDELEQMGIEVKIITGDNELVTKKICTEVGINIKGIITGQDIQNISEEELKHKVNNCTIFARFSPDDKKTVIRLLRENGHAVGYMGDGINDAPSLKTADVGISVSNAVDVARESADIILTKKSLHQLKDGVIEGRKTFGNTMKYIMMGISSNFGNMFSVLGAVLFLPFLPMLPIQIILNNFLYDISQLTIPSDNVDKDFIKKPKRWSLKYIRNFMLIFGPISSVFDYLSFCMLYIVFKLNATGFQTGWFIESLATQTFVIYIIRTRKIPFIQSMPSKYLLLSTLGIVTLGWIIPFTKIGPAFGFTQLPIYIVLSLAGLVIAYLTTVEFFKRMFFRKYFDLQ